MRVLRAESALRYAFDEAALLKFDKRAGSRTASNVASVRGTANGKAYSPVIRTVVRLCDFDEDSPSLAAQ
jgi:hypothetical protein